LSLDVSVWLCMSIVPNMTPQDLGLGRLLLWGGVEPERATGYSCDALCGVRCTCRTDV
jgi:hypothetical protein